MIRRFLAGFGLVTAMLAAAPASAATLLFSYASLSGPSQNFSFSLDSNPAPSATSAVGFTVNVPITLGGTLRSPTPVQFFLGGSGGFGGLFDSVLGINYSGPQLFSGAVTSPIFQTGSFNLIDDSATVAGTLTITTAAIPEPATWAMMLVGFGAAGYSLRRRKAVLQKAA